ncbi:MAG: hypothetical protein ACM3ZC_07700 [Bacteroidota bacterium]
MLFALAGERALIHGARNGPESTYYQSLQHLCGPFAPYLDIILLVFLCVLSGVMLAGTGALADTLGCPPWAGIIAMALLGLAVIACDMPGIVTVNKIVVPCLICIAALVALGALGGESRCFRAVHHAAWLPSALLYASYNTVLSLPVLAALGASHPDCRLLRAGSRWGAAGLVLIGGLVLTALLARPGTLAETEVPMALVASALGRPLGFAYSFVLWAEMFTTLIADVYGASARLRQLLGGSRTLYALVTMALGITLSSLGFARLVRTAYPAFGLVCLIILLRLIRPPRAVKGPASAICPR